MRVLVCGGRNFDERTKVFDILDTLDNAVDCIIQGGATGADSLAREWAKFRGKKLITYFPSWDTHGKAAGPIRNQWMLDDSCPDLVVAFPGDRGTADMVRRAKIQKITVMEIR